MNKQSGDLLLEVLIAITAVVVLVVIGAQLVLVNQRSNVTVGHKDIALKLAEGLLEVVSANAVGSWEAIYDTTKGVAYHPVDNSGVWSLLTNTEPVIIDGVTYTKSIKIENVSRDVNGNIELVYNSANEDPSTQKVTSTITWGDNESVTSIKYISRYPEVSCVQTNWSGGASGAEGSCTPTPPTTYESIDDNIDTDTTGEIKLQNL